jgi:hypothetical protein
VKRLESIHSLLEIPSWLSIRLRTIARDLDFRREWEWADYLRVVKRDHVSDLNAFLRARLMFSIRSRLCE